jgi:hypothetical protein
MFAHKISQSIVDRSPMEKVVSFGGDFTKADDRIGECLMMRRAAVRQRQPTRVHGDTLVIAAR